jgi:hypothetical protein
MRKLLGSLALFLLTTTSALADGGRTIYDGGSLPAVSSVNGKLEAFGGEFADESLGAVAGSISFPLDRRYGLQIDTMAGSSGGDGIWGVGGHLFWRDPARGLLGVYGDYVRWDGLGGNQVTRLAGEGELYLGRFSIESTLGVEFGELQDRVFARTNLAFYPQDDLRLSVGHRYLGGENALALGAEWQVSPRGVALFAEGLVGDDHSNAVIGGLRLYFGDRGKSLIRRHREDDPPNDLKDATQSLMGNLDTCGKKAPPPTFKPAGPVLDPCGPPP